MNAAVRSLFTFAAYLCYIRHAVRLGAHGHKVNGAEMTTNNEILSWNAIAGGMTYVNPYSGTADWDTGAVKATVTVTNTGTGSYTAINNDGSNPMNTTEYDQSSQLSISGDTASGTRNTLKVDFADDTSDSITAGVYDLSFAINDIDAGSSSSFQDTITIRAVDMDGNPLTVSASPGGNFTVTTNGDGSVTITAKSGTNSWNSPDSFSEISISGGPIQSVEMDFGTTRNAFALNNITVSDMHYTTMPICFAAGTLIETIRGMVAVESLTVGDMVRTRDNGYQPVRWIGVNTLSPQACCAAPALSPICIERGALGNGIPRQDLWVSPQHRILIKSKIAQRMFDTPEVLIAAKQLLPFPGVSQPKTDKGVTYVHFLFDQHEIVYANGAEAESLFFGEQAILAMSAAERAEIFAIFPELRPTPRRHIPHTKTARKLIARHVKNEKQLVVETTGTPCRNVYGPMP